MVWTWHDEVAAARRLEEKGWSWETNVLSCLPSRHVGTQHSGSGPSPLGGAASSMKAT